MDKRPLGTSGIRVAPLAFGGNVFGWTADETTSFALLDAFVDAGFDLVDTADSYSRWVPGHVGGESETIIGRWFERSGKRGRVVLATKVGMEMASGDKGLAKERILRAAEASLRRLRTDVIDLYQAHVDDTTVPLDESLAAFDALLKQGKVRAIGASNYTGPRLREALATSRALGFAAYATLQPHYNLVERQPFERDLLPVCRESGIAVIPYFSLANGFLTGKYRSTSDLAKSVRGGGVKQYLDARGLLILDELDRVAARLHATPATIALAWLASRPTVVAPIASATSVAQLTELLRVALTRLDAAAIEALDAASSHGGSGIS
ncbi:MAG TPA: aldo/keto reductase [Planctomycetota bacterium]|nr:aldo/keto reductase [Planctomycetota bacterium]